MRASETLASPESGAEESGILMGFIRTWDRFWFTPMDPTTLAFSVRAPRGRRASTAVRRRQIARLRAIRRTPSASWSRR